MKATRWNLLFGLALLSWLGCSSSDLPDPFRLDDFRVLALVADRPEADPGDVVVISAFLADPNGEGRAITFSAQGCLDPGVGVGAEPSCNGSLTRTELATDAAVTGLAAPNYSGIASSTVTAILPPTEVMFAGTTEENRFNGVNYLVTFQFALPDDRIMRAFRRIVVSTRPVKNQNPSYGTAPILTPSGPLTSRPAEPVSVRVDLAAGAKESYQEYRSDGVLVSQEEQIETFWYLTEGELSLTITDEEGETLFTPADPPEGRDLVLVAVTRDERGGVVAFAAPL